MFSFQYQAERLAGKNVRSMTHCVLETSTQSTVGCVVWQYYRFSVGGMTDVAEIKGHRLVWCVAVSVFWTRSSRLSNSEYISAYRCGRLLSSVPLCWLDVRTSIPSVKIEWWGLDAVLCLERDADNLHTPTWFHCYPSSLASLKFRMVNFAFQRRLVQDVLEKRLLNRSSVVT